MKTCKESLTENDIIDLICTVEQFVEDCQNDNEPINGFEWSSESKYTARSASKLLNRIEKKRNK